MSVLIRWKFDIISQLVGTSVAILLILVFIELKLINSISKSSSPMGHRQLPIYCLGSYAQGVLNKHVLACQVNKNYIFPSLWSLRTQNSLVFSRKMSTSINTNCLDNSNTQNLKNLAFKEWLAGLIDGDGYFLLSKNGYNSCEITMDARDKKVLYLIQHMYGGTVKQISNALAFKYKLRNRAGLIELINDVNGLIRNPTRLLQMNKLCVKFNIELKYPNNLFYKYISKK